MTEITPLAQRLRDVAGRIAFDECGKWFSPPKMGPTQKEVGAVIAATLLRELVDQICHEEPLSGTAGYDEGWADAYDRIATDLTALADSIEKGAK